MVQTFRYLGFVLLIGQGFASAAGTLECHAYPKKQFEEDFNEICKSKNVTDFMGNLCTASQLQVSLLCNHKNRLKPSDTEMEDEISKNFNNLFQDIQICEKMRNFSVPALKCESIEAIFVNETDTGEKRDCMKVKKFRLELSLGNLASSCASECWPEKSEGASPICAHFATSASALSKSGAQFFEKSTAQENLQNNDEKAENEAKEPKEQEEKDPKENQHEEPAKQVVNPPSNSSSSTSTTTTTTTTTSTTSKKKADIEFPYANGQDDIPDSKDESEGNGNHQIAVSDLDNHNLFPSDPDEKDPDSSIFSYVVVLSAIVLILFLVFHNKQKILAIMLEGCRRPSHGRRRSGGSGDSSAQYRKLDSNAEDFQEDSSSLREIVY